MIRKVLIFGSVLSTLLLSQAAEGKGYSQECRHGRCSSEAYGSNVSDEDRDQLKDLKRMHRKNMGLIREEMSIARSQYRQMELNLESKSVLEAKTMDIVELHKNAAMERMNYRMGVREVLGDDAFVDWLTSKQCPRHDKKRSKGKGRSKERRGGGASW